eukprot:631208_1
MAYLLGLLSILLVNIFGCNAILDFGDWTLQTLLRAAKGMAVGYWDGSVFILGGFPDSKEFVEYEVANDKMIDHGTILSFDIEKQGQFYTQTNNNLFMISNDDRLLMMDLSQTTKTLQTYGAPLPTNVATFGCLESNDEFIFMVAGSDALDGPLAGYLDELQILDILASKWISNAPKMTSPRLFSACSIHKESGYLYVIGGYLGAPIKLVEKINVNNIANISTQQWKSVSDLTNPADRSRSVVFGDYILVIGGFGKTLNDVNTQIQIINTLTDSVSLAPSVMNYGGADAGVILSQNIIYNFGGWVTWPGSVTNQWESCYIADITTFPPTTYLPTSSPVNAPSSIPSHSPTYIPSIIPSTALSIHPSIHPSVHPSIRPSFHPSVHPSIHPSLYRTLNITFPPTTYEPTANPTKLLKDAQVASKDIIVPSSNTPDFIMIAIIITIVVVLGAIVVVLYLFAYEYVKKRHKSLKEQQIMTVEPEPNHEVNKNGKIKLQIGNEENESEEDYSDEQLYVKYDDAEVDNATNGTAGKGCDDESEEYASVEKLYVKYAEVDGTTNGTTKDRTNGTTKDTTNHTNDNGLDIDNKAQINENVVRSEGEMVNNDDNKLTHEGEGDNDNNGKVTRTATSTGHDC